jgi:hypothetical protein
MVKGSSRSRIYEGLSLELLNAVYPFNVVPEGNDNEGEPRMGKWYAFLQLEKGVWDRW